VFGVGPVAQSAAKWPSVIESLLAVAAVALILPSFELVATRDTGRDARFDPAAVSAGRLPERVLPGLCASYGAFAEPLARERLCRATSARAGATPPPGLPPALIEAGTEAGRAFQRPLADAEHRRADLRLRQREGLGDGLALDKSIAAIDSQLRPYLDRFALDRHGAGLPLPLACAYAVARRSLAPADAVGAPRGDSAAANAVLLLGAAFDGERAAQAVAGQVLLPGTASADDPACAKVSPADAFSRAAALMAAARETRLHEAKNQATRELLRTAGWQWAGWMLAGLLLLKLSRRPSFVFAGIALSLLVWALAAWIGNVPWPLGSERSFEPARGSGTALAVPARFVIGLLIAAALAFALSGVDSKLPSAPQTLASRLGYPGLVVATGVGWLVLLDLSANGNVNHRYLALYHQGHLWFGMLTLSVAAFARQPFARAFGWTLSMLDALAGKLRARMGAAASAGLALLLILALIGAVAAALPNRQQLSSEIVRLWLIAGASWFFFLRGDPFAERLARSGSSIVSLLRYVSPLLGVALVLVGVQVITRYLGPLLIACYGAGAFVAAAIAMWWHQRWQAYRSALALAMLLFVGWIVAATAGLFALGGLDDVTAGRLENLAAPLASANDQLALVTWFRHAAPAEGFGLGGVPWCGHVLGASCSGVPAQIQSDYTLTALVGVFGWTTTWALTLAMAIWLHRLIARHRRVTRGEPRLIVVKGRIVNDDQALLSWVGLTWVVLMLCQLAVTVAGNLAVLPLTGVTFPFVSFGMTSLVVNMALLGLCINVNRPARSPHA
jgi:cell division protein FtsW (lipid II flippase)